MQVPTKNRYNKACCQSKHTQKLPCGKVRIVSALSSMQFSDVVIGLETANSVRRCDSEFHEVNKYQHKHTLALTARKLVRLVFRLLKDNRLYIPSEG